MIATPKEWRDRPGGANTGPAPNANHGVSMARAPGIGRGWRPIVKLETRRSPWAISGLPVGFGAHAGQEA